MDAPKNKSQRRYLAAVVLGGALAALGPALLLAPTRFPARPFTISAAIARPVGAMPGCRSIAGAIARKKSCAACSSASSRTSGTKFSRQGDERKEFIRAIDTVKKRTQRERRQATLFEDRTAGAGNQALQEEKDALRQAAEQLLSPRQQRILQLACDGWSVADMAQELKTTSKRVSDDKYKAIQKLRAYFQAHRDHVG